MRYALEPRGDSIIPTMQAGKARVKWMASSYRPESRGKSWQIVMDFDEPPIGKAHSTKMGMSCTAVASSAREAGHGQ